MSIGAAIATDRRAALLAVVFFSVLAVVPVVTEGYFLAIAILILQYAYLGQAWNVMTGFAGQLSLGHALFLGLGGYASAVLNARYGVNAWPALLAAIAVGAAAGAAVGYLGFRFALRGIYFALLTLAVAEFFRTLFDNWSFVGGSSGFVLPALPADNNPLTTLRGGATVFYYAYLALNVVAFAAAAWVLRSRLGYFWRAISADEEAARALGVRAFQLKIAAAAISGAMTALGGGIYVLVVGNLYPNTVFSLGMSINILVGPVIGGMGTLFGPILGALIFVPLGEQTAILAERIGISGLSILVYGLILMAIVLFMPEGVWPRLAALIKLGSARSPVRPAASLAAAVQPKPSPVVRGQPTLLRFDGVSKSFQGLRAVRDVSFQVPEGAIVALIGPNGAGKTTCFNLVTGAFPPDGGRIEFGGRSIVGLAPEEVCLAGVGRTFQIVKPLHGMTVLENVMVGALLRTSNVEEAREQSLAVLARIGLAEKSDMLAAKLTLPDRKLLEVARALATRPRLLLLDEVMAGLRPTEYGRIVRVLKELNESGLTILLIEHVMRVVMSLAHHVVVLHHGEKSIEGTPETVTRDPRTIENYLGRRRT